MSFLLLAPALLLLWFPSDRLIPARARLRTYEDIRDQTRRRKFWLWLHPLNAVRAGLGTWLLLQFVAVAFASAAASTSTSTSISTSAESGFRSQVSSLDVAAVPPSPSTLEKVGPLVIQGGALVIAALAQTMTRRDPDLSLAPVFYMSGLLAVLLPAEVSITALVLAVASTMAFRHWMVFFLIAPLAIGGAGMLWEAPKLTIAVACMVAAFPALIAFVTGRILSVPSRQ